MDRYKSHHISAEAVFPVLLNLDLEFSFNARDMVVGQEKWRAKKKNIDNAGIRTQESEDIRF